MTSRFSKKSAVLLSLTTSLVVTALPVFAFGPPLERQTINTPAMAALLQSGALTQLMPQSDCPTTTTKTNLMLLTKYEGKVPYLKHWNFWIRSGVPAFPQSLSFFPNYDATSAEITRLFIDIGVSTNPATDETEIWEKAAGVWAFLHNHMTEDPTSYGYMNKETGWPSIQDFAFWYGRSGKLPTAACFSKAQLLATLFGRVGIPRERIGIMEAHHNLDGGTGTAEHAYTGLYVANQWYYLDLTAVHLVESLPSFAERKSVGVPSFEDHVDYKHPFELSYLPGANPALVNFVPLICPQ